ncbi:MAG: hypothetical protein WC622_01605 [Pedobacter sp.]|jgi:hypothetical protein|uniref:hypothetical protein n=1 Tax=Pedobacter sp. TaxID=1411316 RepID=UPI003569497E
MKANHIFFIVLLSAVTACNSPIKKEVPKLERYTSNEIGWTIEIPNGFQSLSKSRIEASLQKGKEAVGKVAEGNIETSELVNLVNFQKNQFNSFFATIEAFKEKDDFFKSNQLIKKLIFDTYTNQKIKVDTLSGKETIAGQTFNTFIIKIHGPTGEILMNQIMFNQLIKGYNFGVNINYNNETDKKILLDAFKQSKFAK